MRIQRLKSIPKPKVLQKIKSEREKKRWLWSFDKKYVIFLLYIFRPFPYIYIISWIKNIILVWWSPFEGWNVLQKVSFYYFVIQIPTIGLRLYIKIICLYVIFNVYSYLSRCFVFIIKQYIYLITSIGLNSQEILLYMHPID